MHTNAARPGATALTIVLALVTTPEPSHGQWAIACTARVDVESPPARDGRVAGAPHSFGSAWQTRSEAWDWAVERDLESQMTSNLRARYPQFVSEARRNDLQVEDESEIRVICRTSPHNLVAGYMVLARFAVNNVWLGYTTRPCPPREERPCLIDTGTYGVGFGADPSEAQTDAVSDIERKNWNYSKRLGFEFVETVRWGADAGGGNMQDQAAQAQSVSTQDRMSITSHQSEERVTTRVVELTGEVESMPEGYVRVRYNEQEQRAPLVDGRYTVQVILRSGRNAIEVCTDDGQFCATTTLIADIERVALMATLTWQGRGDLDLHVETPSGEHCSFSRRSVPGSCELDIDDQSGSNPENISIPPTAPSGRYRFWVVNYRGGDGVSGRLVIYAGNSVVESIPFTVDTSTRDPFLVREINYR